VNTVKERAEVLLVDSKGFKLEVIADKTKYIMSRDQAAG
jgi:hypothetical protein